jgi:hypothetical protein
MPKKLKKPTLNTNSTERAILLFNQWIRSSDDFIDKISKIHQCNYF